MVSTHFTRNGVLYYVTLVVYFPYQNMRILHPIHVMLAYITFRRVFPTDQPVDITDRHWHDIQTNQRFDLPLLSSWRRTDHNISVQTYRQTNHLPLKIPFLAYL